MRRRFTASTSAAPRAQSRHLGMRGARPPPAPSGASCTQPTSTRMGSTRASVTTGRDGRLGLILVGLSDPEDFEALLDGGDGFDIAGITRGVLVRNCEEVFFVE